MVLNLKLNKSYQRFFIVFWKEGRIAPFLVKKRTVFFCFPTPISAGFGLSFNIDLGASGLGGGGI